MSGLPGGREYIIRGSPREKSRATNPGFCTRMFPGPPVSPRPGPPRVPPSRGPLCPPVPRGPRTPAGRTSKVKNVFRFKLDAKSVPEALATTILILLKFSIDLAHPWGSRGIGPPHPSGTPHRHPWAPPEHPLSTPGHSRGTFEYKNRGSSRNFFRSADPGLCTRSPWASPGNPDKFPLGEREM